MFKFTIRELLGVTAIGAVSCLLALLFAPADPYSELLMAAFLFLFGACCFVAGVKLGRARRLSS